MMQSQRKMLSSGTAASNRSVSERSAGAGRAVATVISGSVDSGAEDGARIEVGLAPYETARHLCERAGIDHQSQTLARSVGDRDEDGVWAHPREDRLDLQQPAEHGYALQAPAC